MAENAGTIVSQVGGPSTIEDGGLAKKLEEEARRMKEMYCTLKEEFTTFKRDIFSLFTEWLEKREQERRMDEFPSLPKPRGRRRMASGEELLTTERGDERQGEPQGHEEGRTKEDRKWTKVEGRMERKRRDSRPGLPRATGMPRPHPRPPNRTGTVAFNPPAVLLKSREGGLSYSQVLAKAKEKVSLRET